MRRACAVAAMMASAILTPPDVITQVLVVVPMIVLYEVGLILARRAQKARERSVL